MSISFPLASAGDLFLNMGDLVFRDLGRAAAAPRRLHTVLGSCVSVVLWQPERRLVGMCHAVLPSSRIGSGASFDGRYCDQALGFLCREIERAGAAPAQFRTYLVGGGRMYLPQRDGPAVGERNVEAMRLLLRKAGFQRVIEHVGLEVHRKLEIELATGAVHVVFGKSRLRLG